MDNNQQRVCSQIIQNMSIKIELMNKNGVVIDELQGSITNGSIQMDSKSLTRRICSIEMVVNDESMFPSYDGGKIWISNTFKLYIGIEDMLSNEIIWFNKGEYCFEQPSISLDQQARTLSFSGIDKMSLFEDNRKGVLGFKTKIDSKTPIFDAIKLLVELGGETKYIINDTEDFKIPYDIEEEATSSIANLLEKIRDLYMGFEMYYNEEGYFVYERVKDRSYDITEWIFSDENKAIISISNTPNWDNVKNYIKIIGREFEDKTQVETELKNEYGNEYSISNLGELLHVEIDDTIQTKQQAEMMAEYLLEIHGNENEQIQISCVQILGLDVSKIIEVKNSQIGINGRYLITNISLDINASGIMNITATKIYK